MKLSGIYEIKNVINGKRYIGSAVNFPNRWKEHVRILRNGTHHSRRLQRSWCKHGSSAFRFSLIRSVPRCYLIPFEQFYMDRLRPEYNMRPTAGSPLGVRHPPETIKKMSTAKQGRTFPRISAAQLGRVLSPEHRAKLSAANIGKQNRLGIKSSSEARARMSAGAKRRWNKITEDG